MPNSILSSSPTRAALLISCLLYGVFWKRQISTFSLMHFRIFLRSFFASFSLLSSPFCHSSLLTCRTSCRIIVIGIDCQFRRHQNAIEIQKGEIKRHVNKARSTASLKFAYSALWSSENVLEVVLWRQLHFICTPTLFLYFLFHLFALFLDRIFP